MLEASLGYRAWHWPWIKVKEGEKEGKISKAVNKSKYYCSGEVLKLNGLSGDLQEVSV